jgi:hypothetical protein
MNQKRIVIDGKTYNSVDEMPEDVRRTYEEAMRGVGEFSPAGMPGTGNDLKNIFADKNNNGIPDVFEGSQSINIGGMKFVVDGRTYNSLDQLPPEARAKYEQAMGSIDANQNGMPDFLEGMMKVSPPPATPQPTFEYPADTTRHASRPPELVSPTIEPDTSNGWMLALAILALLFLCAVGAGGVWYFFLR